MKTKLTVATGLLFSALMLGGSAFAAEAPGKAVSDTWITTKVKSELVADKEVGATHIHVKTTEGVVTLTGTAKSQGNIDRAVEDANKVKGVKSVVNNLQVKS